MTTIIEVMPVKDVLELFLEVIQEAMPKKPFVRPFTDEHWLSASEATDFSEVKVVVERYLSDEEVWNLAGCLGYALRETLAGEQLSAPDVIQSRRAQQTIIFFNYDSTKSRRDDSNVETAVDLALKYIHTGYISAQGTRLNEGIGKCGIRIGLR